MLGLVQELYFVPFQGCKGGSDINIWQIISGLMLIILSLSFFYLSYRYTQKEHEKTRKSLEKLRKSQGREFDLSKEGLYIRLSYRYSKIFFFFAGILMIIIIFLIFQSG